MLIIGWPPNQENYLLDIIKKKITKKQIIPAQSTNDSGRCQNHTAKNKGTWGPPSVRLQTKTVFQKGLLHYYFKNKEEMLALVIKENMEVSIVMVTSIFEQFDCQKGYAKAITKLLKGVMENDPDFFNLFLKDLQWPGKVRSLTRNLQCSIAKSGR